MKGKKRQRGRPIFEEKAIGRGVLTIMLLIPTITSASAYVPFEENNGIRWKFYINYINKTDCYNLVDKIPEEYTEGLSYIKVLPKSKSYRGLYWTVQKSIDLFYECDKEVIVHEIAHHCQHQMGDSFQLSRQHKGLFDKCEDEIWQSIA